VNESLSGACAWLPSITTRSRNAICIILTGGVLLFMGQAIVRLRNKSNLLLEATESMVQMAKESGFCIGRNERFASRTPIW
jgi:hypothetical protein